MRGRPALASAFSKKAMHLTLPQGAALLTLPQTPSVPPLFWCYRDQAHHELHSLNIISSNCTNDFQERGYRRADGWPALHICLGAPGSALTAGGSG
jgi:hypothetical protein